MAEPVLAVQGLHKSFGALQACRDVSLDLHAGEIHALIGPNGAGKSTLLAQIAGALRPDAGRIRFRGEDVTGLNAAKRAQRGLARSFQVSALMPEFSVLQNIVLAVLGRRHRAFDLTRRWSASESDLDEARRCADRTGLLSGPDPAADVLERPAGTLAHGARRRLELAVALAQRPAAFVLDEPMAGMGSEGATDMTALLATLKSHAPILLVEHDMEAVFALADRVTVLVGGRVLATGGVAQVRADPAVQAAYLGDGG